MMKKEWIMLFVKICGITNIDDALLSAELGASAVGFVFAPSKRRISAEQARHIISHLPKDIEKVGVFVNECPTNILNLANYAGLTCVQLHGNESPMMCELLGKYLPVIKAEKITPEGQFMHNLDLSAWKILLDTHVQGIHGGSGRTFNWEALIQLNLSNIIIAGGLGPENIEALLAKVQPFGVDLSSSLEAFPGKKDPMKLQLFFYRLKRNDLLR
ncbi:MAG: phosphoribosylanthranilate isomerase [candidate division KSB1 bacterium]|nr:phosphoribosylanthranilate isomerase [candidate division KSB1 bacterium]MDZ7357151.1 phosphoribosylanthranilate isomerase [candidate division KSB1 bacterium]MDZ7400219.1 phosphoribosylanthranilate isomerase [candidate division KSB1 bacterium]